MPTAFKTGAKPTPRHKLAAATPHTPRQTLLAPPAQFAVIPKKLSFWLNDQEGDCVTAEEAFAKAVASLMAGLPELFVPDSVVGEWAARHGFADGATLTDVMDVMARSGFVVNGTTYGDGPYLSVDYSNEDSLKAALVEGPVKIGIDHTALPDAAGNQQGWYAVGGRPGAYRNEDHCVGLCGYGPAKWLYEQLGVPLPAGLSADTKGYLLFTWSSIGFVDHAWLLSTCGEAWVRNPTTPGQAPAPQPQPDPTPAPAPTPTPAPLTLTGATAPTTVTVTLPGQGLFRPAQTVQIPIPALAVTVSEPGHPTPAGPLLPVLLPLIIQYGAKVIPIVLADLAAKKTLPQIIADILAGLNPVPAGK